MTREEATVIFKILTGQIRRICPIDGISVGSWLDKATWHIAFQPQATDAQKAVAQDLLQGFDPTTIDSRTELAKALDTAIAAVPSIDPRIKAVLIEWRKQLR